MTGRKPILVGYDGSDGSRDALALAKQLARAGGSPLLLAWIEPVGPLDLPSDAVLAPIQDRAEDAVGEVAAAAREQGYEVGTRVGLLGSAAQGIHELAEDESAELVVVGSSHRGRIGQVLAGTVATRLLHGSPCPVAIAPRGFADSQSRLKRIGVGYDGSAESDLALAWAEELAHSTGGTLRLYVVSDEDARRRAEHLLADGLDRVTDCQVSGVVKTGRAGEQLAHHSQHVDLLVVGSRGYGPVRRVLLGSVSGHLVRHGKCPLIVTPRASVKRRRALSRSAGAVNISA